MEVLDGETGPVGEMSPKGAAIPKALLQVPEVGVGQRFTAGVCGSTWHRAYSLGPAVALGCPSFALLPGCLSLSTIGTVTQRCMTVHRGCTLKDKTLAVPQVSGVVIHCYHGKVPS